MRYEKLLRRLITRKLVERRTVAIKLHLGGRYGYTHVHPAFVIRVVDRVKECGGRPFITDHRSDNRVAGVIPEAMGCPIYHATGVKDRYFYPVKTGVRMLPTVEVAGYIHDADVLVNLSHAKGHGQCAFGAAIKNLAMGAVTGRTRGDIHRLMDREFKWHAKRCTHCRKCVEHCEHGAIWFDDDGELCQDSHFCTLCLHCMTVCPTGAITVSRKGWPKFQRGLALATKAVLGTFEKGRTLHINVALNITAICDCFGFSLPSFRPDVGVLASTDPVAVDQASLDVIDTDTILPDGLPPGIGPAKGEGHVLHRIWGKDPYLQVTECAKLKLGTTRYRLKKLT
ncbi:MAG TPA: DUF362 domain-containing protein [Planctomycetota bacterium]|nr:DUF362 domain-containing protein [Planctomycetota bacterium]